MEATKAITETITNTLVKAMEIKYIRQSARSKAIVMARSEAIGIRNAKGNTRRNHRRDCKDKNNRRGNSNDEWQRQYHRLIQRE